MRALDESGLGEDHWRYLIEDIARKRCTPFIGAGASVPQAPLGSQLARDLADEYHYPLHDRDQLPQVAQYIAVTERPIAPKLLVQKRLELVTEPDYGAPDDPHGLLADLELPVYMTTNYDQFMKGALRSRGREPFSEYCRWYDKRDAGALGDFEPTPNEPLVYHLHGREDRDQSMVLTEVDYLDFLVRMSEPGERAILPSVVRTALGASQLLFVGYSLGDWTTRILLKAIIGSQSGDSGYPAVSVNLEPSIMEGASLDEAKQYLVKYIGKLQNIDFAVYWGDARSFARELRRRWDAYQAAQGDGEPR